jgi:hypothetical protein
MERLLVVWAGDVDLGLDYRSSRHLRTYFGTHVVSLSIGEIELPKKKRVFDRIYCNTSQRATKRVMFRVRSLRSFLSWKLVGSGNALRG